MKIQQLRLDSFVQENLITRQEFSYGSVRGKAEMVGYHIIFFQDSENLSETCAITLQEIVDHGDLMEIANSILQSIGFSFRFRDDHVKIEQLYGKPFLIDDTLQDMKVYYYVNNTDILCVGFHEQYGICSLEIIINKKIVQERIKALV